MMFDYLSSHLQYRAQLLNTQPPQQAPVFYWMDRDQRIDDNWALIASQQCAQALNQPLGIVFNLQYGFLQGARRQHDFKLQGLQNVAQQCHDRNLPFYIVASKHSDQALGEFFHQHPPGLVVTDFSPLRLQRHWKHQLATTLPCPLLEVDTHNIVPCWQASSKQEHAAWTLRRKLKPQLSHYLIDFPDIKPLDQSWPYPEPTINWSSLYTSSQLEQSILPIHWLQSGPDAAQAMLDRFMKHLDQYPQHADNANASAQSHLSPYLHYGHIAPQRVALTVSSSNHQQAKEAYLEQLIIRRELADNFCYYNPCYDQFQGLPNWAQKTLNQHRADKRQWCYNHNTLEKAQTHDDLWNACQWDMVQNGKMPGYLRMYWAKKILEWTPDPETAMAIAIDLNDRYELDGRDPNGYVGIAWSIGGVHDHPWQERAIYGKVRYMTAKACQRRFNVKTYIKRLLDTG